MRTETEIQASLRYLLKELATCSAAFVLVTTATIGNTRHWRTLLLRIVKAMKRLQQLRTRHPTDAAAAILRYKPEVTEIYDSLKYAANRVDDRHQRQVTELATEVRSLLEPTKLTVVVPEDFR